MSSARPRGSIGPWVRRLVHPGRHAGGWALAIALLFLVGAHALSPSSRLPIYDGIITEDPYRYLDPPPGQLGDPSSFQTTVSVNRQGEIPDLIATTTEEPPQAQIFAPRGTFAVPSGARKFVVSISPVEPPVTAPEGSHFVGNVYAFSFTTSDGGSVPTAGGKKASIVLRGIQGDFPTTINAYSGGTWQPLKTKAAGGTLRFTNITSFGDFVLIAKGPTPSPIPVASPSPSLAPTPTPRPTASPSPSPTARPSPSPTPTASPKPLPSAAPTSAPVGSPPDQAPAILLIAGLSAVGGAVAVLVRRRRPGQQDWRTYR